MSHPTRASHSIHRSFSDPMIEMVAKGSAASACRRQPMGNKTCTPSTHDSQTCTPSTHDGQTCTPSTHGRTDTRMHKRTSAGTHGHMNVWTHVRTNAQMQEHMGCHEPHPNGTNDTKGRIAAAMGFGFTWTENIGSQTSSVCIWAPALLVPKKISMLKATKGFE